MNDSKIGTWLMRDGRTAVVLVDNEGLTHPLQGMAQNGGYWTTFNWHQDGSWIGCGRTNPSDLIRKVSDSTELKPWKPEKRWRPWTVEELKAKVLAGLWVSAKGETAVYMATGCYDRSAKIDSIWTNAHALLNQYDQHDGTPCGVEVEE